MKYHVVDSSGWLEYFTDGKNADVFAPYIENTQYLIVPMITVHEVFKFIMRRANEKTALAQIDYMLQGQLINLDLELSLESAKLGVMHQLPLADSIILATAIRHHATVWTQDADFKDLPQVHYIKKKP